MLQFKTLGVVSDGKLNILGALERSNIKSPAVRLKKLIFLVYVVTQKRITVNIFSTNG